jgi:hypothetical protein
VPPALRRGGDSRWTPLSSTFLPTGRGLCCMLYMFPGAVVLYCFAGVAYSGRWRRLGGLPLPGRSSLVSFESLLACCLSICLVGGQRFRFLASSAESPGTPRRLPGGRSFGSRLALLLFPGVSLASFQVSASSGIRRLRAVLLLLCRLFLPSRT